MWETDRTASVPIKVCLESIVTDHLDPGQFHLIGSLVNRHKVVQVKVTRVLAEHLDLFVKLRSAEHTTTTAQRTGGSNVGMALVLFGDFLEELDQVCRLVPLGGPVRPDAGQLNICLAQFAFDHGAVVLGLNHAKVPGAILDHHHIVSDDVLKV